MKVEKADGVNGKADEVLNKDTSGRRNMDEVLNKDSLGRRGADENGARPPKRSVYVPQYRQAISTAYPSAAEVNYAAQMTLARRGRDNYFALERLDVSVPERTRSILGQGVKAVSGVTADMFLTLKRSAQAAGGALHDWQYLHKRRAQAARERLEGKLTDGQAAARFMQIQNDYERMRDMGRRAMDVIQKNDERFLERAGLLRDEKDGFTYDLMSGAGTLLAALAVSAATKNPATAAAMFGVYAGRKDYEEAVQNGVTPGRALALSIAGGLAEGGLEFAGLDFLERLFKAKGLLGAAVKGFATEALQEGAQQTAEEMIMQHFGGREQDFDDTLYAIGFSALLGGLLGAPAAAAGNAASRLLQQKGVPAQTADKLAEAALRAATDGRVQAQAEQVLKQATSAADFVNGDIEQSLNEFAKVTGAQARRAQESIYNTGLRVEREALAAGVDAEQARALGRLETARAVSMLNNAGVMPQALTQVHITRGGLNPAGALRQSAAAMYQNPAASLAEFVRFYRENKNNPQEQNKSFYRFQTVSGANIDVPFNRVKHIDTRHQLTDEQWAALEQDIERVEYAYYQPGQKGENDGVQVFLKANTAQGKAGLVLEALPNGRILLDTAFFDSDANIDNWAKNEPLQRPSPKRPVLVGSGTNSITEIVRAVKGQTLFQTAYHGSPHRFDAFSTDAVGTGEGAQAHGWGLYFAADKKTAINYRTLQNGGQILYKGKPIEDLRASLEREKQYNRAALIEDFALKMDADLLSADYYAAEDLAWFQKEILPNIKQEGSLFEVDIPENDVLLDEDKTFEEQPEKVQDGLLAIAKDGRGPWADADMMYEDLQEATGWDIYHKLADFFAEDMDDDWNMGHSESGSEAASKLLNEYGIKGITYDGAQDGRGYVIFDDKAIEVLNTFYQRERAVGEDMFTPDAQSNQNPSFAEELAAVLKAAPNKAEKAVVGRVSPQLSTAAKEHGLNIDGYIHNIDTSAVQHARKRHGIPQREERRGQLAVTDDDFKNIPQIIYNPDFVAFGAKNNKGLDLIIYGKNMPDGSSVYVEEVRTGKKTLTTNSLRKYKTGVNPSSFAKRISNAHGDTGTISIVGKEDFVKPPQRGRAGGADMFTPDGQTAQRFKAEVQTVLSDTNISNRQQIEMGRVPPLYVELGLPPQDLKTNKLALRKALGLLTQEELKAHKDWHNHNVPRAVVDDLPRLLTDPVAVFRSNTKQGVYVAVLDAEVQGKPVLAILSPNTRSDGYTFIPTIYEKDNFKNFVNANAINRNILYADIKRTSLAGPLLQAGIIANNVPINSIRTKEDFVKPPQPARDERDMLFQDENEPRASVTFDPQDNTALLRLFASADRSSAVHEFAHVWRRDLMRAESLSTEEEFLNLVRDLRQWDAQSYDFVKAYTRRKNNGLSAARKKAVLDEIERRGGAEYVRRVAFAPWQTAQEDFTDAWVRRAFDENFAECFEVYLAKGQAPSEGLRGLFERFAQWLRDMYDQVRDFARITPQVQSLFDRLLTDRATAQARLTEKYKGKENALKEVLQGLKRGQSVSVDGMGIKELKELLALTRQRIPAAPKDDLLLTLRREGADYAHTGAAAKEAYANAYVRDKKGGIGDDMARWLADRGYMEPLAGNASYEAKAAREEEAARLVQRALEGEKIYKLSDREAAQAREDFIQDVRRVREMLGDTEKAEDLLRRISALEREGYRVVEKSDLEFVEKQLEELEKAPQKDILRAARHVREAVAAELEKRDIENKQAMLNLLKKADTAQDIYAAVDGVLGQLESAYEQTEEGAERRRMLEVPDTDYGKIKTEILRDINRIYKEADEELKRADELMKLRSAARRGEITLTEEQRKEVRKAEKVIENRGTALYRAAIEAALKGIRHLPPADKGKFISSLASYRQPWRLALEIDGLLRRVKETEERHYKKRVAAAVERTLKESVLEREGRLRKSTVDAETDRVLQELRRVLRLTPSEAQSELAQRADYFAENAPSKADLIKNRLLNYKAKDLDDVSPQALRALYDDVRALKKAGREAMGLQKLIADVRTELEKKEVLAAVRQNKEASALKKLYANAAANWESLLNLVTNKELAEKYSLLTQESDAQVADFQMREKVMDEVGKAYGITQRKELMKKLRELNEEKYTVINYALVDDRQDPYVVRRTGEPFKQELTKAEVMTLYIWNMNEELARRISRAYGESQREELFARLDAADRRAAGVLQAAAEEQYRKINEVFVRTRGYDLPRTEHYFPSQTERVESELDFLATASEISKNPSFIKRRIDSAYVQMRPENPFAILFRHFSRAAAYVHKSEKINQLRRVFRSPAVKPDIINKFGDDTYKVMLELLDNSAVGGKNKYSYSAAKAMNWLTNNYVKSAIAAKPTIVLKQLIAVINYSEDMPVKEWARGFVQGLKTPEKTLRFMMGGDPYLKVRLESGGQNEALARAVADGKNPAKLDRLSSFTDVLTATTRYGDLGAVAFGGYPYVKYLMKQGKTQKEAFELFRKATLRGQQANVKSSLSRLQAQDMNWFTRALFAFRNTPAQYLRKIVDACVQYQRGEISKAQLAKTLAIYGLLNSWLYSMSTSLGLLKFALGGEGDDLAEEIFLSPMVQFFGFMPFVDEIASQTAAQIMSLAAQGKFTRLRAPTMPLLDDVYGSVNHLLKKDVSFTDWVDFTVDLAQPATGLPARYAKGLATGAAAAARGEWLQAWLQALGYTEHRAAVVTGAKQ